MTYKLCITYKGGGWATYGISAEMRDHLIDQVITARKLPGAFNVETSEGPLLVILDAVASINIPEEAAA